MQDLMIDLETLGTGANAPVISIGAVWFDPDTKTIGETFYTVLDVSDQIDTGIRVTTYSTIKWWLGQKEGAKSVFEEKAVPTKEGLIAFRQWVLKNAKAGKNSVAAKNCKPWGNGASFDITLMETLFEDFKVACPWLFYNVMDLRTFKRFIGKGKKVEKVGVTHNALDDALSQVGYIFDVI